MRECKKGDPTSRLIHWLGNNNSSSRSSSRTS